MKARHYVWLKIIITNNNNNVRLRKGLTGSGLKAHLKGVVLRHPLFASSRLISQSMKQRNEVVNKSHPTTYPLINYGPQKRYRSALNA